MATISSAENIMSEDASMLHPTKRYDRSRFRRDAFRPWVKVLGDGRLDIDITERTENLVSLLNPRSSSPRPEPPEEAVARKEAQVEALPLRLNIVIHVVGSRGDVQPFVALGKSLQQYGHRVRLATHLTFRDLVRENGLEYFQIGGDPEDMITFMVKNPGLLPHMETIRSGAIKRNRRDMFEIITGCWRSCLETGDGTHLHQPPDDLTVNLVDSQRPFVADAIIANPPSFAHIHCAEKLGIPLTIMFTMPWSPTQAFPHPLANIQQRNVQPSAANFASYLIVEMLLWSGLSDLINKFRRRVLRLDILDAMQAPTLVHRLHIPHTYLWSPSLLPKPLDWPGCIDVCGFVFLSSGADYKPPDDLVAFLEEGPPPIYVGFGSIVVDSPRKLTEIVFRAIQKMGQRAILSKGWGGLGGDGHDIPKNIFLLGSCPHDWLFQYVSCVVHHGGAGTTAAGLKLGCPTVIVPFFGDQPFWGSIVARDGVGPAPIPYKDLTADKLADAIREALKPSTKQKAREVSEKMGLELGLENAVLSFHRHLDRETMRCVVCPTRPTVWWVKHLNVALSAFAMAVLVNEKLLKPQNVELCRSKRYDTQRNPRGPLEAVAEVLLGSIGRFLTDLGNAPSQMSDIILGRHLGEPRRSHRAHPKCRRHAKHSATDSGDLDPSKSGSNTQSEISIRRSEKRRRHKRKLESYRARTVVYTSRLSLGILDLIVLPLMDVTLSLSRGFRNVPLVYHDDTVKDAPRVTGIRTGIEAAGKEFTSSLYDGVTGLVTQPRRGFKRSGMKGLVKGFGKGMAGFILKPTAGIFGLAAYPLHGLHHQLWDSLSDGARSDIEDSRIAQGMEELQLSSSEERAEVIRRWQALIASD